MRNKHLLAACVAGAVVAGAGSASAQDVAPSAEPPPAPAPPAPPAPVPPHTVAPGESLWKISASRLGSGDRWLELFVVNRETVPNPDLIEAGQVLQIPAGPVAIPADLLAGVSPAPAARRSRAVSQATPVNRTTGARSAPARTRTSGGGGGGGGDSMAGIRQCESGGNYQAVSSGGTYRGAYQFDQQTWESVGGSGDPAAASPGEQDSRAQQLRSQRGSNPWPNCG